MSGVLLDTHTLVWLLAGDEHLGVQARGLADQTAHRDQLLVSAISFWEVAMLAQRARLSLTQPVRTWRQRALNLGIVEIPLSGDLGILATELADFPEDPADRIIGATAITHEATLITANRAILASNAGLERHDARR